TPEIFTSLKRTKTGSGGEVQLTDAINDLLEREDVYALEFEGTRYDAGDKLGYLKAQVALGIKDPEAGKELKRFIRKLKI
ncbi:MAG: UTP--glucose-1-phosphate uridylyltransferase, partial [Deltaproteobacteria bacterium]|nr:UTP--glucose-1-phosphate uridylyltransferase [Deltaproteobacteria bacterium]